MFFFVFFDKIKKKERIKWKICLKNLAINSDKFRMGNVAI